MSYLTLTLLILLQLSVFNNPYIEQKEASKN